MLIVQLVAEWDLVCLIGFQLVCGCHRVEGFYHGCLMSIWIEVHARMLEWRLELVEVNGRRFAINQLLFPDDIALVADTEEKLCRLVNEFDTVCARRKFRMNTGEIKVMKC